MRIRITRRVVIDGLVWESGVYDVAEGYWLTRLLASGAVLPADQEEPRQEAVQHEETESSYHSELTARRKVRTRSE